MSLDDGLYVYKILNNDEYMIGTNDTKNWCNGLIDDQSFQSDTLAIPSLFQGKPITEIGSYAFAQLKTILYINIGENIRVIHQGAFADVSSVKHIYIPSSVEMLMHSSIYFWNGGISKGKVDVVFERFSSLKYVEEGVFSYKETLQIFTPSIITPQCSHRLASNVQKTVLYSPYSFDFCGLKFQGFFMTPYKLFISKRSCLFMVLFSQM